MSYPRTPTTTTSAATTTPNATPNEHYDASPATLTVWATPSASTPSKPPSSPNAASLTAIFDAGNRRIDAAACHILVRGTPDSARGRARGRQVPIVRTMVPARSARADHRRAAARYRFPGGVEAGRCVPQPLCARVLGGDDQHT